MSQGSTDAPVGAVAVLAASSAPLLEPLLRRLAAAGPVILFTDDKDEAPCVDGVLALEPEEVLAAGVSRLDDDFGRDVAGWMRRVFGVIDGVPMSEALWVNVFFKGNLVRRQTQLAYTKEVLDRLRPCRFVIVGAPPDPLEHLAEEAARRGLVDGEPASARARRRLDAVVRPARLFFWWCLFAASAVVRAVRDVRRRRRMDRRLAALDLPRDSPALWVGVCATYRQLLRPVRALTRSLDGAGVPYGVLYVQSYGAPRVPAGDQDVDEVAVLDGSVERFQPRTTAQVVGAASLTELAKRLWHWLGPSLRFAVAVAGEWRHLTVDGLAVLREVDVPDLMRAVTGDLYRTLDAAAAARRWVQAHPEARVVTLPIACFGEIKAPDFVMQAAGICTLDVMHGYASEANLHKAWRSASTYCVAWTVEQADWVARLGTNRHCVGGFAPLVQVTPTATAASRPRVLILSSYAFEARCPTYGRQAGRLARTLAPWLEELGDRIEVRARLHPLDDGQHWERYFVSVPAPPRSVDSKLADDLAWANLVIATPSSTAIDALQRGVPVLLHRGLVIEPPTLFAHWPAERSFATEDELRARATSLLAPRPDLAPEEELLYRCFGPSRRPHELVAFILERLRATERQDRSRRET